MDDLSKIGRFPIDLELHGGRRPQDGGSQGVSRVRLQLQCKVKPSIKNSKDKRVTLAQRGRARS
jgi:hypothetical protein